MADRRTDAQLVKSALEGSGDAFGALVARYKDAVFGVAFHRLGGFEEARDAAQETFVKAFRNLGKLRQPASFANWLCRTAEGTATDAARRRRGEIPLDAVREAAAPGPPDGVAGQVREALGTLPEATRLAVILHYVDGYSHAEVSQFLGTTEGAVKTRVSRGKARLREEMAGMVETKLKKERPILEYHARDLRRPNTVTSGTVDDMSEEQVRQSLTEQGYEVTRVRLLGPAEVERQRRRSERHRRYEFIRRVIRQALRAEARALRLSLDAKGPWAGHLRVDHFVNGKWAISGRMATGSGQGLSPREMDGRGLWDLARGQLAAHMGLDEVPAAAHYTGEMGLKWKGSVIRLRVRFTPKTVRLTVL